MYKDLEYKLSQILMILDSLTVLLPSSEKENLERNLRYLEDIEYNQSVGEGP